MIAVLISVLIVILIFLILYICFRFVFSVPKKCKSSIPEMPKTEQYAPYAEEIRRMTYAALAIPYEPVTITSYDGLTLFGRCYTIDSAAPWLIMFHGYRSMAEHDFGGGLKFATESGYNVLLTDQRAHGKSQGKYLSFGIKEKYDCRAWIDYVVSKAGENVKIALYGISMGAATVLMSTALNLPRNVKGVVADCGYNSPAGIIRKVMHDNHYPIIPGYFMLRLSAMIYGGFDFQKESVTKALETCEIPVLFIHGEDDRSVPCDMGRENFNHCHSKEKELLIIPGAGHGVSYLVDKETYLNAVSTFLKKVFSNNPS